MSKNLGKMEVEKKSFQYLCENNKLLIYINKITDLKMAKITGAKFFNFSILKNRTKNIQHYLKKKLKVFIEKQELVSEIFRKKWKKESGIKQK